jgi:hypothetical protein
MLAGPSQAIAGRCRDIGQSSRRRRTEVRVTSHRQVRSRWRTERVLGLSVGGGGERTSCKA